MADDNGVEPDAETITVTDVFFAGGLRVQARGDVVTQVKAAAGKDNWAKLQDLNKNETQIKASDVLAMVVSEGQIQRVQQQAPPGTPGGGKFKPKIAK